jgi:DNA polymerase-3 subunit delta'
MEFSQILGHEKTMAFLDQTAVSGRPSHAYIFAGGQGVGKKAVALRFAARLNCPDPSADPDFQCSTCKKTASLNYPDLFIEEPVKSIIRIDQIRGLQYHFRHAPIEGFYRIVIIDDANLMNAQSQNALLKTLEEPPPTGMIILITSQPSDLLPTVRSRCRLIRFNPIPTDIMATRLMEEKGYSGEEARTMAGLAQGSFSKLSRLIDSPILDLRLRIIRAMLGLSGSAISDILGLAAELSSDGKRAGHALDIIVSWLRDVAVLRLTNDKDRIIHRDILDTTEFAAENLGESRELQAAALLSEAGERLASPTNINRTLILETALLKCAQILAGPSMGLKPHPRPRER